MDFELNETQHLIKATARDLTERYFAPRAARVDATGEFPWDNARVLAESGFLGLLIPDKYGGGSADQVSFCCVMEEIARGCLTTSTIIGAHFLGLFPLMLSGSEEQKQRYLPRAAAGDFLAAYGQTEPDAGSDVASMKTAAQLDGDYWVLNGTKRFITNGSVAEFYSVFAKTDPAAGSRGVGAFVVEKGTPGFTFGKLEDKMGLRGSATVELYFDDCRIPRGNLIGEPNQGFKTAMLTLDSTRPGIGAQAVGLARAAYEAAVKYAKVRHTFGAPIAEHQAIAFMIADMATEISAGRLLVYQAAAKADAGTERWTLEGSMAKLICSEMSRRVVNRALQIHGGYGYLKDYPVERYYRDQRIIELYEGTSEIQRLVISRHVLGA